MSEQPPTEYAPPGWYPDPTGLQAQRWWDGTQWGHQMRPLPGYQQPARQFPDAATPEAFWRESTGQYSQLSGPQDSTAYPASLPAAQPQLDPHQPAGWPPQSTGAPGPQPLGHRAPRRRNPRGMLAAAGLLVVSVAVAGLVVGFRLSSSGHRVVTSAAASSSQSAAVAHAASPAVAASCQSQASAWATGGGSAHQQALAAADKNLSSDDNQLTSDMHVGSAPTADTTAVAGDLGSLEGAIVTIKQDMPPSCIPGLYHDYGTAMNAYGDEAAYQMLALGALNKGDAAGAQTDLALATASEADANTAMQSALDDLNAFNDSQG